MKKLFVFVTALTFISMAAVVSASDLPKPINKLANGTVEIIKSPVVFFDHTKSAITDNGYKKPVGLLKGLIMAPFHMVKKAGAGVLDVATFPLD